MSEKFFGENPPKDEKKKKTEERNDNAVFPFTSAGESTKRIEITDETPKIEAEINPGKTPEEIEGYRKKIEKEILKSVSEGKR
jgi:hypothetical protein